MDGHQISDESIALSYKHASQVAELGKGLEHLGTQLRQDKHLTQGESEFVQETAQQIQEHANAMIELTDVAKSDKEHSTEAFVAAGHHHTEATKLHIKIGEILARSGFTNQKCRTID